MCVYSKKRENRRHGENRSAVICLSNLSGVSINTSLVPQGFASADIGSFTHEWKDLWLNGQVWNNGFGVIRVSFNPNFGQDNISVGAFSIQNDEVAHGGVSIGIGALFNNQGSNNVAIGWTALSQVFKGNNNAAVGSPMYP